MKLKQILKSKSGVAIENAVMFILVIFLLCALLTSLTLIGHYQVKYEKNILIQDITLEQIGEDYLECVKKESNFQTYVEKYAYYEKYDYKVIGNALSVWLKDDENKNVLLYVEAERTVEGEVIVNKWRYSLPSLTD